MTHVRPLPRQREPSLYDLQRSYRDRLKATLMESELLVNAVEHALSDNAVSIRARRVLELRIMAYKEAAGK